MKAFKMKYIKNKTRKSNLGNKEQKSMFLASSQSDVHFDSACPFFACPIRQASKIAHPKTNK